jgi:small ligand-binding sensory domain FIST
VPFATALSEHPLATHAVGEVVGEVLDRLGDAPDVAILFVGAPHTGAIEDIANAVRTLLQPAVFVACTAGTVVGGDREVEDTAALSLWAGRVPTARAHRLDAVSVREGRAVSGFPGPDELDDVDVLVVLADPFTFPAEELLESVQHHTGGVPIIGGFASAARGPGGNRLVRNGEIYADGAVAIALGGVDVATVVSQGCRPIGDPMVVTRGHGSLIEELAGRSAVERVQETVQALPPDDAARAASGLHVGRVIDERKATFGHGDFLIRGLRGVDRRSGAIAVDDELDVGATVQLQIRDAEAADEDLRNLLAGHRADGALMFTCNGRGTHLFGVENHDARVLSDVLDRAPIAGMSCAGELGPVGGRSFVHTFTASVLLLSDRG